MASIISVLSVAALLVLALAVPAFAEPQGKGPGECGVLGTAVSKSAKDPGPIPIHSEFGGAPGQILKATCTPAPGEEDV